MLTESQGKFRSPKKCLDLHSKTVLQHSPKLKELGTYLKLLKRTTNIKWLHTGSSTIIQVKLIQKYVFYTLHMRLSSLLKISQWRFQLKKGVNNDFSSQFGIFGLVEGWITADELNGAI